MTSQRSDGRNCRMLHARAITLRRLWSMESSMRLEGVEARSLQTRPFELTIAEVDVFDFARNKWSTLPSKDNLPTQRAGAGIVVVGRDIIVGGGESMAHLQGHWEVEAFNTASPKWQQLP